MSTPSGWYSDPQREGHTRYWDGSTWGITDDEYQQHHGMRVASQSAEPTSAEVEPKRSDGEAATTSPDSGGGLRRLQCDLCNGTEFTKEEEFFVCDFCRTKYSPETARKMMIQGTVEVAGTVQVDRAGEVANLVLLSQTALANHCAEESYDYANRALQIDATSWEAWRCKGWAACGMATVSELRVDDVLGSVDSALAFAPAERRDELQEDLASDLYDQAIELYRASVNDLEANSSWNSYVARSMDVLRILDKSYAFSARPEALRGSIQVATQLLDGFWYDGYRSTLRPDAEQEVSSVLAEKALELQKLDPAYVPPQTKRARGLWSRLTGN